MATFHQKKMLLKGLLTGESAFVGPLHAMIDVTRRCNLNCFGCRYHSSKAHWPSVGDQSVQDLDWDMFTQLCQDLTSLGTREDFFIGEGEPFLHPLFKWLKPLLSHAGPHRTWSSFSLNGERDSAE
jgi:hypothetical protein